MVKTAFRQTDKVVMASLTCVSLNLGMDSTINTTVARTIQLVITPAQARAGLRGEVKRSLSHRVHRRGSEEHTYATQRQHGKAEPGKQAHFIRPDAMKRTSC